MITRIKMIVHPGYHYELVRRDGRPEDEKPQFNAYDEIIGEAEKDEQTAVVVVRQGMIVHERVKSFLQDAERRLKNRLIIAANVVSPAVLGEISKLNLAKQLKIKAIGEYAGTCTADEAIRLARHLNVDRQNVEIDFDNSTSLAITTPLFSKQKPVIEVIHPGSVSKLKETSKFAYFLTKQRVDDRLNEI